MEDGQIIALYQARNERAITETMDKYGAYCTTVACNVLADRQDAEECVNDTYLTVWNRIPPDLPARPAACPLCMAAQKKVCFDHYDAVGFAYMNGTVGSDVLFVPFYTFYKYIGLNEYGAPTYAMTYVCAVRISEYDAYYNAQKQNHR